MKKEKVSKFIFWTPRILAILFILFLAMFSLDIFDSCNNFFNCALGLFMHNLPSIILTIILIIAWKYEIVGAIVFFLFGLWYIVQFVITGIINNGFHWYYLSWIFIIAGPAFLVGILFWINWVKKKKS